MKEGRGGKNGREGEEQGRGREDGSEVKVGGRDGGATKYNGLCGGMALSKALQQTFVSVT